MAKLADSYRSIPFTPYGLANLPESSILDIPSRRSMYVDDPTDDAPTGETLWAKVTTYVCQTFGGIGMTQVRSNE